MGSSSIILNEPAVEVLDKLQRIEGNPFVIVGAKSNSHLKNLKDPWAVIRDNARLVDFRLHDLRHSFASFAVAEGLSLPVIGALLGHSQPSTTARYAHLARDPLAAASELTANKIRQALGTKPASSGK
ncbi:tyrosine-type recombinase/integrase [Kordiimonas sp.]|uniref:tyrosine-type recombinase/integrase n=1 Tax=Kordiimonas sp. TaxID=1970157 RepID=UPI003A926268